MRDFLKKVLPYYRPYKGVVLLGLLFVVLANAARVIGPWLLRLAVNGLEGEFSEADLWRWALLILAAAAAAGVFTLLMRYFVIGASRRVEYDLRKDIMGHFYRLDPAFYDRQRIGDLMTRTTSDVEQVRMVLGPALMYTVNTLFGFVFAMLLMLAISVKLTLIVLAVGPFVVGIVFFMSKRIHRASHRSQEAYSDLSAMVQESVSGIRVIKAFRREEEQREAFDESSSHLRQRNLSLVYLRGVFMPAVVAIFGLAVAVILLVGGQLIIEGALKVGDFVAFVSYLMMLTWPMISTGWVVSLFQRGLASLQRISAILDREPGMEDRDGAQEQPKQPGRVRFDEVTFTYPKGVRPALRDLSFELSPGKTLGVVGRVGSGKSTIAHLLTRLYEAEQGRVEFEGVEVRDWSLRALRERLGIVPQDPLLFSTSLRDNILLGGDFSEQDLEQAVQISQLAMDLEEFPQGLDTEIGERGLTLSGGQKQRVAIARAVIRRPQVLLFDDALSAVDADTEERILENLHRFLEGRSAIIISHRITSVVAADEILVLDDGAIVERGTHKDLIKAGGQYADIFQQQRLAEELEEVA